MMLTGYFDDSGHVNSKQALIVSGFVAPVGQWTLFERDWRAVLKRPEFSLDYLHMKEFRSYRGQYKKFKNNLDLETALFKRLHHVIERRAEESFGCIVLLDDWARVNQEYMLEEKIGHPFAFAGTLTIHKTLRWMEKAHPHDFIKFVFDHGTDGWGDFVEKSKERSNVPRSPELIKSNCLCRRPITSHGKCIARREQSLITTSRLGASHSAARLTRSFDAGKKTGGTGLMSLNYKSSAAAGMDQFQRDIPNANVGISCVGSQRSRSRSGADF